MNKDLVIKSLLESLPTPRPGSGDSPVTYEKITRVDQDGNTIILEYSLGSGWSVQVLEK